MNNINETEYQQVEQQTIKPVKEQKEKDIHYRDFSNRRSFNNTPCAPGEILVPFVLSAEMCRTMEGLELDRANVETWHFIRPIPVAFIPVAEEKKQQAMTSFCDQVRWYLEDINCPMEGNGLSDKMGG